MIEVVRAWFVNQMPDAIVLGTGLYAVVILGCMAILGLTHLLVLPVWAILDCLLGPGSLWKRLLGSSVILLTWGLGNLIYGLSYGRSDGLRMTTLFSLKASGILMMCLVVSCPATFKAASQATEVLEARERKVVVQSFAPGELRGTIEPFWAVRASRDEHDYPIHQPTRFTMKGPVPGSGLARQLYCQLLAVDPAGPVFWACRDGLSLTRFRDLREAETIPVPPGVTEKRKIIGMAFDTRMRRLLVLVEGPSQVHGYDPMIEEWVECRFTLPEGCDTIAYDPMKDGLWTCRMSHRQEKLAELLFLKEGGKSPSPLALDPAVPLALPAQGSNQLVVAGRHLVLVLAAQYGGKHPIDLETSGERILAINPDSGRVLRAP